MQSATQRYRLSTACRRLLLALLPVLVLAGCTAKLSYNRLDWLIGWHVDDYIDWTAAQRHDFDARLASQLDWHRATQLLRYRDWLRQLQADLRQPIAVATLTAHLDQLDRFAADILRQLHPDIVALLADLSNRQVEEMLVVLAESNHEDVKKYRDQSATAQQRERRKNMTRLLEDWVGKLEANQRQLIADWAADLGDANAEWLASRANWTERFTQALSMRHRDREFSAAIYQLFVEPEQIWPAEYRAAIEQRTQKTLALIARIHATLSERQRQHLDKSLEKWVDMLTELAADS